MDTLKLYKAIEDKAFDARVRLDRSIDEAVLSAYRCGYKSLCIVRWQRFEANRFICAGRIFTPDKEKQARALAAEMQGTLEIMEFKSAIPTEQLEQLSRSLACRSTDTSARTSKVSNSTSTCTSVGIVGATLEADPSLKKTSSAHTAMNTSTSEDQCPTDFT